MCGITGIYNLNKKEVQKADLISMRDVLEHRGPDDEGTYISPDLRVGLAHRRLSIIDLTEAGHQPMTNEDKTIWITYNGEIYNFQSLRKELERRGHTFRSKSDTEVIIHAYEEYGAECVKKFNGMFAFVIWDEKKKTLFAARDQLGIKPLYYSFENGRFLFGSEIKAILKHPDFKKELNENNISYYLTFGCMPAPHTLFKGVQKLPSAHTLTIDSSGKLKTEEYWNPASNTEKHSEEPYASETKLLLEDSIKKQMVSDVPFGCFLSGGIDSSTNAALMSRALGEPVETFSIGVKDFKEQYNEFKHSRKIADLLGAKKHEVLVGREDFINFLPEFSAHTDDPNADHICFLVYSISKLARDNGVIVAQVGEGADEIFAGYDSYLRAARLLPFWKIARRLPIFLRRMSKVFAKSAFSRIYADRLVLGQEPFWGHAVAFSGSMKDKLLSPHFARRMPQDPAYQVIQDLYAEIDSADPNADNLKRMAYVDIKIRLAEFLLMRVDRMAMANSIETRVPFLDHRLVELAMSIPQDLKIKGSKTKNVLKQAVRGIIPDEIIDRKKQGFGAPVAEWLKNRETAKEFTDIIFNSKLKERKLFDYEYIKSLIKEHQSGKENHTFRIWNLITLSLWYDYWFS
ncbi:asparagine synthase (glutamine-hydrolyzing) [bacterium]|nr:asparagine synthase (glutamine-hydrolyzing) [bacterium]|tara:strand:+ start:4084 stop:5973 length:1890 start_codon:yes stop_codon:yes gene_type:complete